MNALGVRCAGAVDRCERVESMQAEAYKVGHDAQWRGL